MALTLTLTLIFSLLSLHSAAPPPPFDKIYAFGDSYTDTGNTKTSTGPTAFNYVSNPPYGITFFHRPTNRYSDGRIVIDFVAEALSLPLLPPYRDATADRSHGISFAVGGATAIRHGFFLKNNVTFNLVPQSLQTQLVWFNKILASHGCIDLRRTPKECGGIFGNSLIWLGEIGANDYTSTLGSSIPKSTIQNIAVRSSAGFIQAIVDKGAKYIVVQGLPPTGCSPYSFSLAAPEDRDAAGCVASMNYQTYRHNAALQASLEALRRKNPAAMIVYADYYNAHLTVLKNAGRYGFKEPYRVCCGYGGGEYNFDVFNTCGSPAAATACANPAEYINWDGAHFTEAAYRVMTTSFLNGSYCSPPFRYLLSRKVESS
ncbi:GDSL esterase/lipase At3g48460 [Andrographis paniculata]|uniref:GDSL esterase/lipase At3g48460 n=1 Tax=Andrographis paniculata TaxID=175694 RepID=UPI0021E89B16|nr:GDSL esterase/lipase At3g48460 [Andrographis paniculata]